MNNACLREQIGAVLWVCTAEDGIKGEHGVAVILCYVFLLFLSRVTIGLL